MTGGGFDFDYLAERLAVAGWQVICPDLPGHGRSTQFNESDAYSTGNMSRVLAALFRAYARRNLPLSVLGTSWGGAAMLLFLAAYRLPVDALIVNARGIFGVAAHRTVQEFSKFYAFGSGGDFAMGSMHSTYAEAGRSAGSRLMNHITQSHSHGGRSGRSWFRGVTRCERCAAITAGAVSPSNGFCPVSAK